MSDITRTISNTVGTIPQAQSVAGSTATTDTTSSLVLQVTGTANLSAFTWSTATGIPFPTGLTDGTCSPDGYYYIYVPDATPKIAKIVGITLVSHVGSNYTYAIQLDTAMTGASSSAFSLIIGNDFSYSYDNVGGASATIDGASVATGQSNAFVAKGQPSTNNLYRPVYVDARSTTVAIQESNDNPSI